MFSATLLLLFAAVFSDAVLGVPPPPTPAGEDVDHHTSRSHALAKRLAGYRLAKL